MVGHQIWRRRPSNDILRQSSYHRLACIQRRQQTVHPHCEPYDQSHAHTTNASTSQPSHYLPTSSFYHKTFHHRIQSRYHATPRDRSVLLSSKKCSLGSTLSRWDTNKLVTYECLPLAASKPYDVSPSKSTYHSTTIPFRRPLLPHSIPTWLSTNHISQQNVQPFDAKCPASKAIVMVSTNRQPLDSQHNLFLHVSHEFLSFDFYSGSSYRHRTIIQLDIMANGWRTSNKHRTLWSITTQHVLWQNELLLSSESTPICWDRQGFIVHRTSWCLQVI